jgi:hypothetical protein
MIYRFRVIFDNDTDQDVFRDLEIRETDTMEDLHNAIAQSFGFEGLEMASFYISDDNWHQGEEISMFDVGEGDEQVRVMSETIINDVVFEMQTKLIYVYDFLNLWTFLVELAEIVEEASSTDYPNLLFIHGQLPDQAPEKSFEAEDLEDYNEFEDDVDTDDYNHLDFDEHWN